MDVALGKNVMAEISAQPSVSWLQSSSVHLDPWSLLDLTTLLAAFLDISKWGIVL